MWGQKQREKENEQYTERKGKSKRGFLTLRIGNLNKPGKNNVTFAVCGKKKKKNLPFFRKIQLFRLKKTPIFATKVIKLKVVGLTSSLLL